MNPATLRNLLSGQERTPAASLLRGLLRVAEPFYGSAIFLRNRCYDKGYFNIRELKRTTISVGNITTGGTGKTPIVIDLAKRIAALGRKPAVLLRGYHSTHSQDSDEAQVLRNELGSTIPVEPNPSRIQGAAAVLEEWPEVNVFVLDDAFQHRKVHRELNIVLIDATLPWGFGHMLPRGLLREPMKNLKRADGVIITRADQVSADVLQSLEEQINHLTGEPVLALAKHSWRGFRDANNTEHPLTHLREQSTLGVCGLGNPTAFWNMLQSTTELAQRLEFPDHHRYAREQVIDFLSQKPATTIVTTEKDWVKWQPLLKNTTSPLPIYRPILGIEYLRGENEINELLKQTLHVM